MIKKGIKYIIYWLTFLFPRSKKIILFGGALDNFIDNAKHYFIYCNKKYPNYTCIWITGKQELQQQLKSLGYCSFKQNSFRGIYYALRAKYYFFDNAILDFAYPFLSGGAIKVNLWHGIPLKKIGYDDTLSQHRHPDLNTLKGKLFRSFAPDNYVLCPSEKLSAIFQSAFRLKKERIIIAGYPRTIPFFESKETLLKQIQDDTTSPDFYDYVLKIKNEKRKVVVYMPTFRDLKPDFLQYAFPDMNHLNTALEQNNIFLLLKLHRFSKTPIHLSTYKNIEIIDNKMDIYPLLPFTDALITDYSSIFFDYALLRKPIIYYPYDLEEYKASSRELYFDYEELIQNNICYNYSDLLNMILDIENIKITEPIFFDKPTDFETILKMIRTKLVKQIKKELC